MSIITTPGIPDQDAAAAEETAATARDVREPRESATASSVALAGLALLGVALVVAVTVFGVTLVRLATGSMTPTYPTDSVLVVRSVPAAEVQVGDVVTVSRSEEHGTVPVTHRVVEMTPLGTSGAAELVLRGDANAVVDPEPYQVARVGLVLGGIPFGGGVLAALQSPFGLGLATVVVGGLVLWAWWPRRAPGAHVRESS